MRSNGCAPSRQIVGEEFGGDGQADWRWILDPIDGTVNYANGVPRVGDADRAHARRARRLRRRLGTGARARRWWACHRPGCVHRVGTHARVADGNPRGRVRLVHRRPRLRGAARRSGLPGACSRAPAWCARSVTSGPTCWSPRASSTSRSRRGSTPGTLPRRQVIIAEAGGRFSDFDGADRIDSGNVISTNGLLHDEMVRLMRAPDR